MSTATNQGTPISSPMSTGNVAPSRIDQVLLGRSATSLSGSGQAAQPIMRNVRRSDSPGDVKQWFRDARELDRKLDNLIVKLDALVYELDCCLGEISQTDAINNLKSSIGKYRDSTNVFRHQFSEFKAKINGASVIVERMVAGHQKIRLQQFISEAREAFQSCFFESTSPKHCLYKYPSLPAWSVSGSTEEGRTEESSSRVSSATGSSEEDGNEESSSRVSSATGSSEEDSTRKS